MLLPGGANCKSEDEQLSKLGGAAEEKEGFGQNGQSNVTRVSNELGAGNPHKARLAACTVTFVAAVETFTVCAALFVCRHFVGRAYSSEKQVVDYIAAMGLLLCISIVTDSFQAVISGIARGSGWQHIGAYVNLGAFYLIGIPVSLVLGFIFHHRAKGFWIGIVIGSAVQAAVLSIITAFTNWQKQVNKF
nr:protein DETOXIFICATION 14-like [Ipomoea batatas]